MSENRHTGPTHVIEPPTQQGPLCAAQWMPVFIEPIAYSGERITALIAFHTIDGKHTVINTLPSKILDKMLGSMAKHLQNLTNEIARDLTTHLSTGYRMDTWRPPFQHIYTGRVISAKDTNLEAIINQARMNFSFLSAMHFEEASQEIDDHTDTKQWQATLQTSITQKRPALEKNFSRAIQYRAGAKKATIGYVGNHLALNFAALDPRSTAFSSQQSTITRKILELSALRGIQLADFHKLEVCIIQPNKNQLKTKELKRLEEAENELEFMGDQSEIRVKPHHSTTQAQDLILSDAQ